MLTIRGAQAEQGTCKELHAISKSVTVPSGKEQGISGARSTYILSRSLPWVALSALTAVGDESAPHGLKLSRDKRQLRTPLSGVGRAEGFSIST